MIVEKNRVISINYELMNDAGDLIESTLNEGPMTYLHGADNIMPALEAALEGKSMKARVKVSVSPEEGYGEYIDEMVQSVPLEGFPNADKVEVGVQFQLDTSQGPQIATITKVDDTEFTLDMNHPLAGQTLQFDIEVVDIREATAAEIEKGHLHGDGCGCGHSHDKECGCDGDHEHGHGEGCGCGHSH